AREVERVLGRLEQSDGLADVAERDRSPPLRVGEPCERPVETDPHVGILGVARPLERRADDFLGACDLAEIGQRIAEQHCVSRLGGRVAGRALQARPEQVRRLPGAAARGVDTREVAVDVDALARRAGPVRRRCCLGEELEDRLLGAVRLSQPDGELEIRQPELAGLRGIELRAGLEEVGRDAELPGQLPERLHRRLPRARLDAGDIGVRDPRGCQLTLREASRQPQALEALPDGLARGRRGLGRHWADSYVLGVGRQWAAPSCSVVIFLLSRVTRKEGNPMLRRMLSVRLALLVVAVAAMAALAAGAPWGPV